MKNLTRFDNQSSPLTGLSPRFRSLDTSPQLRVNVKEDTLSYIVTLEIPGVHQDDINVNIMGNEVSISTDSTDRAGPPHSGKNHDRCHWYCAREPAGADRSPHGNVFGHLSEITTLIDRDGRSPHTHYNDGVLEVTLPKKFYCVVKSGAHT